MIGYSLKMECHLIDPTLYKIFLKQILKRRFIRAEEWPPSWLDVNPLDLFYWDFVKTKVY